MSSSRTSGLGQVGTTRAARREQAARVEAEQATGGRSSAAESTPPEQTTDQNASTAKSVDEYRDGAGVVATTPLGGSANLQALASTFRTEKPTKEQWGTQLPVSLARRINLARRILNVPLTDLTERVWTEWLDSHGLPHADENGDAVPPS